MKYIAPNGCRLIVSWDPDRISPNAGSNYHILFQLLTQKYNFIAAPNSIQAQQALAQAQISAGTIAGQFTPPMANFFGGHVTIEGSLYPIAQLDFALGAFTIVLSCHDSDVCDRVFDDMAHFLEEALGYHDIKNHCNRRYISAVIVEFERDAAEHLGRMTRIIAALNEAASDIGIPGGYGLDRLAFGRDPESVLHKDALWDAGFLIERRFTRPHSENRYHCVGPLRKERLIELLTKIERDTS